MAISFVGVTTVNPAATGSNSVSVPAGTIAGDFLILIASQKSTGTTFSNITTNGWREYLSMTSINATNGHSEEIYYKFAAASESAVTLTMTGSDGAGVICLLSYRGVLTINPIYGGFKSSSSASATTNTLRTLFSDELVLSIFAVPQVAVTWSTISSGTSRVLIQPSLNVNCGLVVSETTKSVPGSTTAVTATITGGTTNLHNNQFSLIPDTVTDTRFWAGGTGNWGTANFSATRPIILGRTSCSSTTLTTTGSPPLVVGMTVWSSTNVSLGTITAGSGNSWTVSIGGTYASQIMTAATIGASVPTSVTNVFFEAYSGVATYTVSTNSSIECLNFVASGTITNSTSNHSHGASTAFSIYGSWCSGNISMASTSTTTLSFVSTTTGRTIEIATEDLGSSALIFNGVGGGWQLLDDITTLGTITVTAGALNTAGYDVAAASFNASGSTTRSVTLGASTITLSGSSPWTFTTTTNLTFSGASSTINCSGATATFAGGGLTYGAVNFTSSSGSTHTITGTNTFSSMAFTSKFDTNNIETIIFSGNQTISGTLNFGPSNRSIRRMFVRSDTLWTQRTLTVGTLATLQDVDFRDIVAAGASGTWSGTRIGNCGNNSNITFNASKTVYWASTAGVNASWDDVCWATSSGGTPAENNFPLAQDTAIIDDSGATTGNGLRTGGTITLDKFWNFGTFLSTRTFAYTFSQGNQDPQIYGNLTLSSGMTFSVLTSPTWQFFGYGTTQTITSNGKSLPATSVTVNSPGGTVRLLDAFTQTIPSTATTATLTLTAGTLDLNGFTLTALAFSSTGSGVRTLAYGSTGKIVTTGGAGTSQTVFTTSTSTNLTVTGSANVECFLTSGYNNTSTIRTISPGTSISEANSFNISLTGGGVDTVLIANTSNFKDFSTAGHGTGGVLFLGTTFTSYGNLVLGTGTTLTIPVATNHITFSSTSGTKTITTNGVALNKALTFNGVGGTWEIQNALSISSGTVTLTNGTLKLKSGAINDISTFATTGTNQKFLQSTTPGTQTTLRTANTGLNDTLTFDYLTLQDINANTSPDTTIYYAGLNSTSNGNVTGWTFTRGDFLQMF